MTADAPTWGPWKTYYNSVGQGLRMSTSGEDDAVSVNILFSGFTLEVGRDARDAPLAGAVGLAGELSVSIPEKFDLSGFKLTVNCSVDKTFDAAALLTCSIGTGTYTREWPLREELQFIGPNASRTGGTRTHRDGEVTGTLEDSFTAICFMEEANPATSAPDSSTHPPLAPLPITLGMQARCQSARGVVRMEVTNIHVSVARHS
jgi:hypothetical protein